MYSIALLMALTTGNEAVDGHRGGRGCCGAEVASCGCSGGRHHHERHARHHRGHGCCGAEVTACAPACAPVMTYGCTGGAGCVGGHPIVEPIPAPMKKTAIDAPATIVVQVPADATLLVDGIVTTSSSDTRVLVSPELQFGKEFTYTLTARAERDGKTVNVDQVVTVRAGEESRVTLSLPVAGLVAR